MAAYAIEKRLIAARPASEPTAAAALVNGQWLIQSVRSSWTAGMTSFKRAITASNLSVPNYTRFWLDNLAGGT